VIRHKEKRQANLTQNGGTSVNIAAHNLNMN